ncbi:hypothetical protein OsI_25653 [Oryza sativa Indica Group]|uniref:Uncharacterized protein n=1 Tax=Oryza sativa subsp. indica TaxID=39946 RepID=B8B572_ORYSI|nr:hypothetical protein OsI_25653 [Oryza sativa Indica Group]
MLLINSVTLPEPSGAAGDGHCHGAVVNMVVPPREPCASPVHHRAALEGVDGGAEEGDIGGREAVKHNVLYRACLVDANVVPWLLCLLSSTAVAMQDNVVASLLNLSKHPARRMTIVEVEGVGLVVNLIQDGAYRSRKNAMVSLYGLLQSAANQGKAIAAGAVSALAALLSTDRDDLAGHSIKLMARKAEQPLGAMAVLSQPGLVAHLTDALAALSSSRSANVVKQHDAAVHKKHH